MGRVMAFSESLRVVRTEERGLTGLETAIVLIAFVVVAAVFSYIVLSAGVFSAEKSKQGIYSGLSSVQCSLSLNGSVLAIDSDSDNDVDQIAFTLVTALGGEPIDLTEPTDSEPVINTLEFDAVSGKKPHLISISGDVYAVAYEGAQSDGYLKTVEIADSGTVTDAVIDTLEFDTTEGKEPFIVNVSGDIYAIVYKGVDGDGFLKTVEIAASGAITDTVIDTLAFDTGDGKNPHIVRVSAGMHAIAL
jgi:flagellin FlaB